MDSFFLDGVSVKRLKNSRHINSIYVSYIHGMKCKRIEMQLYLLPCLYHVSITATVSTTKTTNLNVLNIEIECNNVAVNWGRLI